jgi:hypothetical protein
VDYASGSWRRVETTVTATAAAIPAVPDTLVDVQEAAAGASRERCP